MSGVVTPSERKGAAHKDTAQGHLITDSTMPGLNLGDTVPNFKAETTNGEIQFHDFIGDSWSGAPVPAP
jgi:hypothetical protein